MAQLQDRPTDSQVTSSKKQLVAIFRKTPAFGEFWSSMSTSVKFVFIGVAKTGCYSTLSQCNLNSN